MNTRILLARRPSGLVEPTDFSIDQQPVPDPGPGQILTRNLFLSVDPYMRARMNDVKSYVPPFALGEPLEGGVVAEVIASCRDDFAVGDVVSGMLRWETHSLGDGAGLHKVDPGMAPLSWHLGILGMPGMTAWVGLTGVAGLTAGESVFVSAAAGGVGSVVGQIARNLGCRVAGCAGSAEKVAYLREALRFDAAFDYRTASSPAKAVREACPDGIDVLFENVGGPVFEACLHQMRLRGRIALCGMLHDYGKTLEQMGPGPRGLAVMVAKRLRMQGFLVFERPDLCREWVGTAVGWLREGRLTYRETVAEGIEAAPSAFIGMLRGDNVGKQIVRLA